MIKAEKDNVKIGIESLLDKEQNKLLSLTAPVFNKVLSIDKLNDIYQQTRHVKETKKFVESFFEKINLTVKVKKEQIANIPKDGPVMIVANHPYGGIDGMILMGILKDAGVDPPKAPDQKEPETTTEPASPSTVWREMKAVLTDADQRKAFWTFVKNGFRS